MVRVAGLMRRMAAGFPVNIPSGHTPDELLHRTPSPRRACSSEPARRRLHRPDQARARQARHRDPALEGADRRASGPGSPSCSGTGSTRCSRRWWWTRRTRSRSSPGCRSTSRSPSPTRSPARPCSPGSRCRRRCRASSTSTSYRYVPIEDVIAAHLNQLFGGMDIIEHYVFRVTRVRELEVDEDVTENLLQAMERELVKRTVRARRPARGRAGHVRRRAVPAGPRAVRRRERGLPAARAARPDRPERHRRPADPRAAVPAVRAERQGRADRHLHLRRPRRARHPGAPPLRLVHHDRAAAGRGGRRRPPGARHQADAVPHQRRRARSWTP